MRLNFFIQNCDVLIDIIVITETWYKNNETQIYEIAGYFAFHSCRARRGGGVSIYVRSSCTIDNYEIVESDINAVSVEVSNIKGINRLLVIGVYRPPNGKNYGEKVILS